MNNYVKIDAPSLISIQNISELLNSQINNAQEKISVSDFYHSDIVKICGDEDTIICPILTMENNIIQYSKHYAILRYDRVVRYWIIKVVDSAGRNFLDGNFHSKLDSTLFLFNYYEITYVIKNFICRNFNIPNDLIPTIYISKYVKNCSDKFIMLKYMDLDSDLPSPIMRIIIKSLIKLIGHSPIKFKKMS